MPSMYNEFADIDRLLAKARRQEEARQRAAVDGLDASARCTRSDVLPTSLPPRGLSRVEAAAYVGVSASLFDRMVSDGRMPKPKLINSRTVWDRTKLDGAFAALPDKDGAADMNPWDEEAA